MVSAAFFVVAPSMLAPVSACPGPTHATVDVRAVHGPVDIAADMTLAQIAELANRTGRIGRHPPLGFYVGGFGYTAITDVSVPSKTECSERVRVTVTLILVDRHIEIGKELKANPCLFSLVRDHYRRHAASDDAALTEFARTLEAALKATTLPPWRTTRPSPRRTGVKWRKPSHPPSTVSLTGSTLPGQTPATRSTPTRRSKS